MTKQEIEQVLALSLEYYKLEIFGTEKQNEPPTQERIEWIYERMNPSISSDVEEAAEKYEEKATEIAERSSSPFGEELYGPVPTYSDAFESGAEWQHERLMKEAREHLPKDCETLADIVGFAEGVKLGRRLERQDLMKEAVECNVIWYDGRLLDFTQQQLDAALDKIGAGVDAKVSVIIIKKEK